MKNKFTKKTETHIIKKNYNTFYGLKKYKELNYTKIIVQIRCIQLNKKVIIEYSKYTK